MSGKSTVTNTVNKPAIHIFFSSIIAMDERSPDHVSSDYPSLKEIFRNRFLIIRALYGRISGSYMSLVF